MDKIKKILSVIGAVLTVIGCTFFLVFLRRRDSDGPGSTGIDERNQRIEEGLESAEGKIADSRDELRECRDTAERCEEHLRRAEEILRNAVKRGEEEKH